MKIPDSAIRLSYLWPCNAAMAAFNLADFYGCKITAAELRDRWAEQYENCCALRELGERPEKGFTKSERVEMVERLVA